MVCEDDYAISPLFRKFANHFNELTPEERKQEYEELKEYNTVGPKIVTNDMIEFEQKLVCCDYPEEVEEYLDEGWHITQISACNKSPHNTVCYVLLEREQYAPNKDDMICE
jgi:hypothetical protein